MAAPLYKPRIFISHSAKEPEARKLCEAIAAGVVSAGFERLWDGDFQATDAWRAAIDEWIWRCDAAVLVLSKDAVESKYVAYEAALLRQRWLHMKPRFVLIPVWCPGVNDTTLVQSMGAVQLAEIHTNVKIDGDKWPDVSAADAFDGVIQEILESLKVVWERSQPRHEIEKLLITNLDEGTAQDSALTKIADDYQLQSLPAGGKTDRAVMLARLLLDFGGDLGEPRFQRLKDGIPTMVDSMQDSASRVPRIVKLVAPFCWVAPEGVAWLPSFALQPPDNLRAIAWVRRWPFSESMYLYRAFCSRSKLHIVHASDLPGGGSDAIFNHIVACLGAKVCHKSSATPADVKKRIGKFKALGEPVFLTLPAAGVDDAVLSRVCSEFSDLCVFLHTDSMDEQALRAQFPKARILEPELDEEMEDNARIGWCDCMEAAGWTSERAQNVGEFDL